VAEAASKRPEGPGVMISTSHRCALHRPGWDDSSNHLCM